MPEMYELYMLLCVCFCPWLVVKQGMDVLAVPCAFEAR